MSTPFDPVLIQKLRRDLAMRAPGLKVFFVSNPELVKLVTIETRGQPDQARRLRLPSPGQRPPEEPEEPGEEPGTQEDVHWIGFRLIEEGTDEPIDGVTLRLTLPTGAEEEHTTGGDGRVRVRPLPEGTCDIEEILGDECLEVVEIV